MLNGTLIREARERCNLSQAKLADALGVVELTVWRWENKPTRSLDYQTVRGLVDVLGLDEGALFLHGSERATAGDGHGFQPAEKTSPATTAAQR